MDYQFISLLAGGASAFATLFWKINKTEIEIAKMNVIISDVKGDHDKLVIVERDVKAVHKRLDQRGSA